MADQSNITASSMPDQSTSSSSLSPSTSYNEIRPQQQQSQQVEHDSDEISSIQQDDEQNIPSTQNVEPTESVTTASDNNTSGSQVHTATTSESAPSTTNTTDQIPPQTFPVDPGIELRRGGGGGFAALVDAFLNGFRQAAAAAALNTTSNTATATPSQTPQQQQNGEASNTPQMAQQTSQASAQPPSVPSSNENSNATQNDNTATTNNNSTSNPTTDRPRTLFFRMPLGPDGRDALLAFTPGPIPIPETNVNSQQTTNNETESRPNLNTNRGNGLASGFHLPHSPIFVPLGASPLPFSFLFDTQTNTAWPIANITTGPPGAMPLEQPIPPNMPQFVTGPPFRIALNISFGPPPEVPRPDPERAARFVSSLERADAELRSRMARLGMGDIGVYGGDGSDNSGALGCGVCLDEYPDEDRPEWIGGQSSIDEEVVAVPCAGHHTLHHRCLYEWLANTPPSQWTCPFCRAPLDKEKVEQSANNNQQQQTQQRQQTTAAPNSTTRSNDEDVKKSAAEIEAKRRTLREEVRLRERTKGWRCDSPACLPRYPGEMSNQEEAGQTSEIISLISLLPCRHKLHIDCLCTSMKLEQAEVSSGSESEDGEEEEVELAVSIDQQVVKGSKSDESEVKETVGKWVTCPSCRHEAWAELPVRRKPKRSETNSKEILTSS